MSGETEVTKNQIVKHLASHSKNSELILKPTQRQ